MLGWNAETDRHLVLYDDGEHERLIISQERASLLPPQRGIATQIAPGLPEGECMPENADACAVCCLNADVSAWHLSQHAGEAVVCSLEYTAEDCVCKSCALRGLHR